MRCKWNCGLSIVIEMQKWLSVAPNDYVINCVWKQLNRFWAKNHKLRMLLIRWHINITSNVSRSKARAATFNAPHENQFHKKPAIKCCWTSGPRIRVGIRTNEFSHRQKRQQWAMVRCVHRIKIHKVNDRKRTRTKRHHRTEMRWQTMSSTMKEKKRNRKKKLG